MTFALAMATSPTNTISSTLDASSVRANSGQIRVRNLWKEYAGKVVLEQINLDIEPNTLCAIVGASGCGKSTFLRMLLGQESPTRGEIRIDQELIRPYPDDQRGVVFQRYSVFPHLRVLENVSLAFELPAAAITGHLFGAKKRQARERATAMLSAVGLEQHLRHYPHQLSGGQQQRLALAQSLAKAPRLLLLDEPFGALDPGIRSEMHSLIRKLRTQSNITIVMVTHDLSEGFSLADRVITFDKRRTDPHDPNRYGATITYDIKVNRRTYPAPSSPAMALRKETR